MRFRFSIEGNRLELLSGLWGMIQEKSLRACLQKFQDKYSRNLKFYSREREELMTVGLKVDLYWYSIGTGDFLHSFFSTICVRLENNVWGSRFPILMNELYSGKLEPHQLEEALRELETIQKELERSNPNQVVWDNEDRSKMPPWGDNISPDIKALSDYFVTSSGKNLISVIKRALLDAIDEQVELEIKSL